MNPTSWNLSPCQNQSIVPRWWQPAKGMAQQSRTEKAGFSEVRFSISSVLTVQRSQCISLLFAFCDVTLQIVGQLSGSCLLPGIVTGFAECANMKLWDGHILKLANPPGARRHRKECLATLEGQDICFQGNEQLCLTTVTRTCCRCLSLPVQTRCILGKLIVK